MKQSMGGFGGGGREAASGQVPRQRTGARGRAAREGDSSPMLALLAGKLELRGSEATWGRVCIQCVQSPSSSHPQHHRGKVCSDLDFPSFPQRRGHLTNGILYRVNFSHKKACFSLFLSLSLFLPTTKAWGPQATCSDDTPISILSSG